MRAWYQDRAAGGEEAVAEEVVVAAEEGCGNGVGEGEGGECVVGVEMVGRVWVLCRSRVMGGGGRGGDGIRRWLVLRLSHNPRCLSPCRSLIFGRDRRFVIGRRLPQSLRQRGHLVADLAEGAV